MTTEAPGTQAPGTDALTAHLVARGLASSPDGVQVTPLAGGVSNDVVAVHGPGLDAVVKQALGRLRVAEEWLADPARIDTEGRALQLAGRLVPGSAPEVYDLAEGYLVIERAPDSWVTWKEQLLAGEVDVSVAARLGQVLGTWQRATLTDLEAHRDFDDVTAFGQLRVDPFHRTVAARHPDLADVVDLTVEVMAASRTCLVHGDYTPKNVLVAPGGEGLWVIDWEVAHIGDPTFDPAWTIGHLLLKTVHRPASAERYATAARAFLTALTDELNGSLDLDGEQLVRQTGCLLLARVDGKSPADYLDEEGRRRTRDLARRLLTDPPTTVTDAWELLT